MADMRLGGIDPSILRELSGVYKPFVKAFKELISNAFDADAERVVIAFAEDFSSVSVTDDGNGMSPFEFRNDFTRIGGGSRRWAGDRTRRGRLRIGSKGIGFLAMARYCDRLIVESSGPSAYECSGKLTQTPGSIDLTELIAVPVEPELLRPHLSFDLRSTDGRRRKLVEDEHFFVQKNLRRLTVRHDVGAVTARIKINCRHFAFRAVLDFEKLLRLADQADLEDIDDFASIDVVAKSKSHQRRGSTITADNLKGFVRRELRADRRKGFVRNVSSRGGYEMLLWQLSRCTPISYGNAADNPNPAIGELLRHSDVATLANLEATHGKESVRLERPVYPIEPSSPSIPQDMLIPIAINEAGLKVSGFLAGYESIIFPAEYRGISIRVRGVAIGDPGFLGSESLLTGANRAALSQITGEIIVERGLDAVDTLNPGRESFYEESDHFKILRRHLVGEGERVTGHLGRAISAVLRRSQVRSSLADTLGRVGMRRKAIEDVSAAVSHLITRGDKTAAAIRTMLKSRRSDVNGLANAPNLDFGLPPRIGGLQVVSGSHLPEAAAVDFCRGTVTLDTARPEWNWSMQLFDRSFEVLHKKGQPDQPIAEIDLKENRILVNWGHAVKLQMDERGFLRTALAWVLARAAGENDPDQMMDLALRLLAFTTQSDG